MAEPPFLSDSPTGNTALPCQSLDRLWVELKELSNLVGCKDVMHVMDFWPGMFSACSSNELREYVEPVHLFDHLESAGTGPRRVGDVVGELINAAIDRAQIAELDMRHHYRKLVESSGRMIVQKLQAIVPSLGLQQKR